MNSARNLALLLARRPELLEHTVAPPALTAFVGMDEVSDELTTLVRTGCADGAAHAALGNVLVRHGRYLDAVEAYRVASDLDPAFAQAHLAASELAYILRDAETSERYRAQALALQRVYADPIPARDRVPILLLMRDAAYGVNTPLELLLDRGRFAIHKYYLCGDREFVKTLPPFDVAITAFGYVSDDSAAIATAFAKSRPVATMNNPQRLAGLARETLDRTLAGIDHVVAVPAQRVARDALRIDGTVVLVRPADTHAGDGLALVDSAEVLASHVARFSSDAYHISPFYDYGSADGLFRKYRVIFVDGVAYPYHLAISPRWMVHYQSAPMRESATARAEELAFLHAPQRAVPHWNEVMPAIARAIGLDYFGIDLGVLPDGRILVFEADSAMLVHDEDPRDVFAHKRPFVARIRVALSEAIERLRKDARDVPGKSGL